MRKENKTHEQAEISAIIILAVLITTGAILTAVTSSGTTLTWEKTFDAKKPEIAAKIKTVA